MGWLRLLQSFQKLLVLVVDLLDILFSGCKVQSAGNVSRRSHGASPGALVLRRLHLQRLLIRVDIESLNVLVRPQKWTTFLSQGTFVFKNTNIVITVAVFVGDNGFEGSTPAFIQAGLLSFDSGLL